MKEKQLLYDWTWTDLVTRLESWGFSAFHAKKLWQGLYGQYERSIGEIQGLRPDLIDRLESLTYLQLPAVVTSIVSKKDGTEKFLLEFSDGQCVETVAMRYPGRVTVCVSTQVGCAMGCVFCATGQMGFSRHLSAGEIVAQVLHVLINELDEGEELRNIVLMGMGEPLHNLDATLSALSILSDDRGLAFGPSRITLSTVGLPEAIRRLADEEIPVNLAVSLHAASDEERNATIPVSRRWSLEHVLAACRYYVARSGRRIFFEWTLIAGRNDSVKHARALGRLLDGLDAHVNLIPLNPTPGFSGNPSGAADIRRFQDELLAYGIPSTVRRRKGIDIDAGCGQLYSRIREHQIDGNGLKTR